MNHWPFARLTRSLHRLHRDPSPDQHAQETEASPDSPSLLTAFDRILVPATALVVLGTLLVLARLLYLLLR